MSFTSLNIKNLYDTSSGFLDDFSIEEKDKKKNLVRQKIDIKETTYWTGDANHNINLRIRSIDNRVRSLKAGLSGNDFDIQLEELEKERREKLDIAAKKKLKHEKG